MAALVISCIIVGLILGAYSTAALIAPLMACFAIACVIAHFAFGAPTRDSVVALILGGCLLQFAFLVSATFRHYKNRNGAEH